MTFRVIIDTNTLLRGLASTESAAARLLRVAEQRKIIPLLSKPVIDEYRAVLTDKALLARFPAITLTRVDVIIRRFHYVGEYVRAPDAQFVYRRDPLDEKFLELAIAANATHIVSADHDLLSLPRSRADAGKRFRQRLATLKIVDAATFLRIYEREVADYSAR